MDIKLSERVQRIKPSPTLAVTARAAALRAEGQDIIGLGAGEPDFDTPEHIKDAAKQALDEGFTKYTPVPGTPGLREAVVKKFRRDNGLEYTTDQVLVSVGGKQSFFNLFQALIDKGDEVIIPAPYWVTYPDSVLLADGKPVVIDTDMASGFKITPQQIEDALTQHTKCVILNSPSNPTGQAYSRAELAALGEVLKTRPDIIVATDDMYEHILWTEQPFENIVNACPALHNQTIVMNGVSKAYSMTGWRIGFAAGPQDLVKAMTKVQSQSTSGATSIAQKAAEAALLGDQSCVKEMTKAFKKRHDTVVARLNEIPGVECLESDGTFYAFPSFAGAFDKLDDVENDQDLAEFLIEKAGVALVPGSAFGAPGHLRLSFATSEANLGEALERIAKALS